jgi:hypothetical protein
METSIRLFHMNDADKPQEGTPSQQDGTVGAIAPQVSNSLAAPAANGHNAGETAMARSELLEVADPDVEGAAAQATVECEKAGIHRKVDVLPDAARVEDVDEEDEEDEDDLEVAVTAEAGDGLIDLSGFEAMFERFQTPIINFIFRLVGNREQAYDLAQDVFVKAYKALAGGTRIHSGALSAWLYRIAANTATDALRRKRLIAWLPLSSFKRIAGWDQAAAPTPGEEMSTSQGRPVCTTAEAIRVGVLSSGLLIGKLWKRCSVSCRKSIRCVCCCMNTRVFRVMRLRMC